MMGLYLAACVAFARGWMKRRAGWWIGGGLMLVACAWLFVMIAGDDQRQVNELSDQICAVTIVRDTPFRTGNSGEYPARLDHQLPAGVEVSRLVERGGWVQVQLAGGPVGWVPRDCLTIVGAASADQP